MSRNLLCHMQLYEFTDWDRPNIKRRNSHNNWATIRGARRINIWLSIPIIYIYIYIHLAFLIINFSYNVLRRPITINICCLKETSYLEPLLEPKLNPDQNWNSYISSIAKWYCETVRSLYHPDNYVIRNVIIYLKNARKDRKWSTGAVYEEELLSFHFLVLIKFKINLRYLVGN